MADSDYGADVPISMPRAPVALRKIGMEGFAVTDFGLFHDLDDVDVARLSVPTYRPTGEPDLQVEYGDS